MHTSVPWYMYNIVKYQKNTIYELLKQHKQQQQQQQQSIHDTTITNPITSTSELNNSTSDEDDNESESNNSNIQHQSSAASSSAAAAAAVVSSSGSGSGSGSRSYQYKITNINCKSKSIHLPNLYQHNFIVYCNPTQRGLPISKYKLYQPKASISKTIGGVSSCVGTNDEYKALLALMKTNHSILKKTKTLPWISDFSTENLVVSIILPYKINLNKLHNYDPITFKYDPSNFPGVIFRSYKLDILDTHDSKLLSELLIQYKEWYNNNIVKKNIQGSSTNTSTGTGTGSSTSIDLMQDTLTLNVNNDLILLNEKQLLNNYEQLLDIMNKYQDNNTTTIYTLEDTHFIKDSLIHFWRYMKSKKNIRIFKTGKVNIVGIKVIEDVESEIKVMEHYTKRCQIYSFKIISSNSSSLSSSLNHNSINSNTFIDIHELYSILYQYKHTYKYGFNGITFINKHSKKKYQEIFRERQQMKSVILNTQLELQKKIKSFKRYVNNNYQKSRAGTGSGTKVTNNKDVINNIIYTFNINPRPNVNDNPNNNSVNEPLTYEYGLYPDFDVKLNEIIEMYKELLHKQNNLILDKQNDIILEFNLPVNKTLERLSNISDSTNNLIDQEEETVILPSTDIITFNIHYNGTIDILDADTIIQANHAYDVICKKFLNCCIHNKDYFIIPFSLQDIQIILDNNGDLYFWIDNMTKKWQYLPDILKTSYHDVFSKHKVKNVDTNLKRKYNHITLNNNNNNT